jgi:hypothetical protein
MHVVGQNDPGIDTKGRLEARPADRLAQHYETEHGKVSENSDFDDLVVRI